MSSTDQLNTESDQEHILLKQGDSGISIHFSTSLYAASWCQFTCISNDDTNDGTTFHKSTPSWSAHNHFNYLYLSAEFPSYKSMIPDVDKLWMESH